MKALRYFLAAFLFAAPVYAETLDRIVAVVDKQIILQSELDGQVELYAMQAKLDLSKPGLKDTLESQILDRMIDDKVLLVEAQRDTSINVTNKEVEDALTSQIERIRSQFASEDAFQAQLRAEGLTLKALKSQYRDEVRNQLLKEQFIQKELEKVHVSSGEVMEFYQANRDSLPDKPAGVKLAHILIGTSPSKATLDSLYNYAELIRKKALEGEDFATLAKAYSQDPSANDGGDLGWFSRGTMVPAFEDAAFALQPGQISEVIQTQYGYHIIKCTGRKEDKIRASHILIRVQPSDEDLRGKLALADSIYDELQNGADFGQLARKYSNDETSADSSGELGWYSADDLLPAFKEAIQGLEPGQVSRPVYSDYGYHIVKLEDRRAAGKIDPKEDYDALAEMARRDKTQRQLEEYIARISSKMYIDKRL
jgi:peptidyl-prolyl cis-trans isomerase SurA